MTPPKSCYLLDAANIEARIDELCDVLTDCVTHGASVSFILPFEASKARTFWHGVAQSVDKGERLVLAVDNASGVLVGTVQLILQQPENQPHRADVAKLLVHSRARRQGLARQLMMTLEAYAAERQKRNWCWIPRREVMLSCSTTLVAGSKPVRSLIMR